MKRKVLITLLALVLVVTSLATLTACKKNKGNPAKDTLVIGYDAFSNKFSPFFGETAYDQDVYSLTSIGLLAGDRGGNVIKKGIEGETVNYNGKNYTYYGLGNVNITQNADGSVDYDITIRSGDKTVYFSDGRPVTIDDVIFSMYVLSDPTYDGASTFYTLPIEGMIQYRTDIPDDTYAKFKEKFGAIAETKREGFVSDKGYTEEEYNKFWEMFDAFGKDFAQEIINAVVGNYLDDDTAMAFAGKKAEDIKTDGLKTAFAMALWGFGGFTNVIEEAEGGNLGKVGDDYKTLYVEKADAEKPAFKIGEKKYVVATKDDATGLVYISAVDEEGKATAVADYTGKRYAVNDKKFDGKFKDSKDRVFDFATTNPTAESFFECILAKYGYDFTDAGLDTEAVGKKFSVEFTASFIEYLAGKQEGSKQPIDYIKGIKKTGDNSLRVHMTKFSATSIYQLSLVVAPKHYYGSDSLYNYASNKFGFPKGDLSLIRSKTTAPMGAGPYVFKGFKDGIVSFERNEKYWEGTPKIKYI